MGEFAQHIESGALKALAVSSEEPVSQLPDVPTITEEGYDVVLTNWRGVIAPGEISDGEKDELVRVITELHESEAWTEQLETKGWTDAFLVGEEFDEFQKLGGSEIKLNNYDLGRSFSISLSARL